MKVLKNLEEQAYALNPIGFGILYARYNNREFCTECYFYFLTYLIRGEI